MSADVYVEFLSQTRFRPMTVYAWAKSWIKILSEYLNDKTRF
jgi:hypothetical protein